MNGRAPFYATGPTYDPRRSNEPDALWKKISTTQASAAMSISSKHSRCLTPTTGTCMAAAIHCGASVMVTANLRDFPINVLSFHGIEAQHPDAFILGLFQTSPNEVIAALRELRGDLMKPALTAAELLAAMGRQGLSESVDALGLFVGRCRSGIES
jgi:hypothetical protein